MRDDLDQFSTALQSEGLHSALRVLNEHTPHRFTGVYRFDGDMLRNIALFDRWSADVREGPDAPMAETFCAIVPKEGLWLEVVDGRADARYPWMNANPVVCYCGAVMKDAAGEPFGTVCHFDLQPCEAGSSQVPLLLAATPLIFQSLSERTAQAPR